MLTTKPEFRALLEKFPLVKISGYDRYTFMYQIQKHIIKVAVVRDEAHLTAGYAWELIGSINKWLIYISK